MGTSLLCRKLHPWPWGSFVSFIPFSFPSFSLLSMLLGILYLVLDVPLGTGRDLPSLLLSRGQWHFPAHLCRRHGESLALLKAVGHGHSLTPSIKGVRFGSYFQQGCYLRLATTRLYFLQVPTAGL